jgi:hypothetical protein
VRLVISTRDGAVPPPIPADQEHPVVGRAHTVIVNVPAASKWFSVGAGLASSTVRVLEHGAVFGESDFQAVEITPS